MLRADFYIENSVNRINNALSGKMFFHELFFGVIICSETVLKYARVMFCFIPYASTFRQWEGNLFLLFELLALMILWRMIKN